MDKRLLSKSFWEVFWISFVAFFPIALSLIFQAVKLNSLALAIVHVLHPSEVLAFCLSFLAPSIIFIKQTHGISYKLPWLDWFFYTTLFMYIVAIVFVFVVKNNVDPEVTKNLSQVGSYINYSLWFLFTTVVYRIYSTYHTKRSSDFLKDRKNDEDNFTENFKKSLHGK